MVLKSELQSELHKAMRSGDHLRRETLRLVLSSIKLAEVEKRGPLDESAMLSVLQKEVKIHQEAIEDARKAGRQDMIETLIAGQKIIESYLPEPLSQEEVTKMAEEVIIEVQAQSPQDMGNVMKVLMPRVQGRVDGKIVNQIVRSLLLKE